MGQAEIQRRFFSVEEYFEMEDSSEIRHEFYNGEVFAMAGGSLNHNRIIQNVSFSLRKSKRNICDVFTENVKLELKKGVYYVYPDVMLTCNPFDLRQEKFISHPNLIVEVLSDSTENYDRKHKLKRYKEISSVQYYMLVSQNEADVELYSRMNEFQWKYEQFTDLKQIIDFDKLGIQMSLSEIYENIIFPEPPPLEKVNVD